MHCSLEIDSIVKKYGKKLILSDVCLKCETNDIVAIFGRNGSGKSTLLKVIFGTESADYKNIKINGRFNKNPYLTKGCISYLPQSNFIPKYFTVKKVIILFLKIKENDCFFNDPIISKIASEKINKLSAGELRYLQIKLILSQTKEFIILDEPFLGLSPILIEDVKKMIIESAKTKGILITDHNYVNILEIATKKYLVHNNRCTLISKEEELKQHGYLH